MCSMLLLTERVMPAFQPLGTGSSQSKALTGMLLSVTSFTRSKSQEITVILKTPKTRTIMIILYVLRLYNI